MSTVRRAGIDVDIRRVFVVLQRGHDASTLREGLNDHFSSFGEGVAAVEVHERRGFAFVTFHRSCDLEECLADKRPSVLFSEVKRASDAPRRRVAEATPAAWAGQAADLALQSTASHADRLVRYVELNHGVRHVGTARAIGQCRGSVIVLIEASASVASELPIESHIDKVQQLESSAEALARELRDDLVVAPALTKVHVVRGAPQPWEAAVTTLREELARRASGQSKARARVRVQTFPPSAAARLVAALAGVAELAPARHELLVSLVELADGCRCGVAASTAFTGHMPARASLASKDMGIGDEGAGGNGGGGDNVDTEVCRAERKLWEALRRYEGPRVPPAPVVAPSSHLLRRLLLAPRRSDDSDANDGGSLTGGAGCAEGAGCAGDGADSEDKRVSRFVALDCGAAPGGWTKLLSRCGCFVFAVDPAQLAPAVAALPTVEHWRHTLQAALALPRAAGLSVAVAREAAACGRGGKGEGEGEGEGDGEGEGEGEGGGLDVWASDMCQEMEQQVEMLTAARAEGLLRGGGSGGGGGGGGQRGTLVVLTLKCRRGHSAAAFDAQAAQQTERLCPILEDVSVLHLFANRDGERTVVGYVR